MTRRMSDVIVADYLALIGSGQLPAGAHLPAESAMCTSYGVSRRVVRDAIRTLAAKGFVIARQGSPTVVAPRPAWNVLDPDFLAVNTDEDLVEHLQRVREIIEPIIARLATGRFDPGEIERLEALQGQIETHTLPEDRAMVDFDFHQSIARATGNPVLASLLSLVSGLGYRTRVLSFDDASSIEGPATSHHELLRAFRAGDAEAAAAAMDAHMTQVRRDMVALGILADDRQP